MAHTPYQVIDLGGMVFSDRNGRSAGGALTYPNGNIYEMITTTKKPFLVKNFTYDTGDEILILPDFMSMAYPILEIIGNPAGGFRSFSNDLWTIYFGVHAASATLLLDIGITVMPSNKVYFSITKRTI